MTNLPWYEPPNIGFLCNEDESIPLFMTFVSIKLNKSKQRYKKLGIIVLYPVNKLIITSEIIQPAPLLQLYSNLQGGANLYVRFLYVPQTIFYHNWGQVSG